MDCSKLKKRIELITGRKVNLFEYIGDKEKGKILYRVVLSDGESYLLKKISLTQVQYENYLNIQKLEIPCFQKTRYIWSINNNEYLVLVIWINGMNLGVTYWQDANKNFSVIKTVAKTLRDMHETNKTDKKVDFDLSDIRDAINENFLTEGQKKLIEDYFSETIDVFNKRYKSVVHGDLHFKNIIENKGNITFIDTDDAKYGDPYLDLVYAANIHYTHEERLQYYLLLQNYFDYSIPKEFWIIVNGYVLLKAIEIMKFEANNSLDGKPIMSMGSLLKQNDCGLTEKPRWFKEYEKSTSIGELLK